MSDEKPSTDTRNPWVIDTRELGRRPGLSRSVQREAAVRAELGVPDVITVPRDEPVDLELLLESVVEGVLVSGTAIATATGQCSRCLDPIQEDVEVDVTELFAYPDSTTEATTDEDEVSRLVDDKIDLEPLVRDALVLALPQVPLCSPDCAGLCAECGAKWADLEPGHGHETIDPRWAALVERLGDVSDESEPVEETRASGPDEKA